VKLKKPLPKWAPLVGIVVGALVVILLGWMVLVSPQKKKAADLTKQAADVQQQIQTQLAAVAAAKQSSAVTTTTVKVANVYKLAQAMPSTPDVPDLLIELSQVTKDSGVLLQQLSPSAPTTDASTGQTTVPISMTVTGDFYTVTDLLYRLRNLVWVRDGALEADGRLFNIDNVSLSPTGSKVSATLSMHAFVYSGGAAAATTPAPAVPAPSTDTTSTDTTQTDTTASAAGSTG
jgi:Tfp pilus assembly protein PilO